VNFIRLRSSDWRINGIGPLSQPTLLPCWALSMRCRVVRWLVRFGVTAQHIPLRASK